MNFLSSSNNQFYNSLDELIAAINIHAAKQDYAMIIKRTKKNKKNLIRKTWIICDKSRKARDKKHEKRQKSSRKTECSFEIVAVLNENFWTYEIKHSKHNHDFIIASVHSVHRRAVMIENMKSIIETQIKINTNIRNILSEIRLNSDSENSLINARDIYNQRQNMRQKAMNFDTSIQSLMRELIRRKN